MRWEAHPSFKQNNYIITLITGLRRCYRKLRVEEGGQQKGRYNNPGKEQQSGKKRLYTACIFKIIGMELKQCFVSGFKGWRKVLIMMPGFWGLSHWSDKVAIKMTQNVRSRLRRKQFCFGGVKCEISHK